MFTVISPFSSNRLYQNSAGKHKAPVKAQNFRKDVGRNFRLPLLEKKESKRQFWVKVAFFRARAIISAERFAAVIKEAVLDNSLDPDVYKPVLHWSRWLTEGWTAFRAPEGRFPRLTDGYTHLILTGSEASILKREGWVDAEVDLVRDALAMRVTILGSCYGHQLLALAIGGPSYAFTLHFDEVVDPGGLFKLLAETPLCRIHAFQYGERPAWGIQAHPEIGVEDGQDLLEAEFERAYKGAEMIKRALRSVPRDTELIRSIVPAFLGA
jgi:GMP synthase-like glutamine amidotransferase